MELIQEFKNYLLIQKKQPSKATVKNYVADVKKFIAWYEQSQGRTFNPSLVTLPLIEAYKQAKINEFTASSIDRHLSSLKKFFTFLKLEGKVAANPFDGPIHIKQTPVDLWHLKEFKDFLYVYNASHLTIKNYLIDVKQFLNWFEHTAIAQDNYLLSDRNLLQKITDQVLEEYATRLYTEGKFSGSSVNRKLSSLRKYLNWAHAQGYLAANTPTLPANMPASLLNEIEENTNDDQLQESEIRETQAEEDFSQAQNMTLEEPFGLTQVEVPADEQQSASEKASAENEAASSLARQAQNEWQDPSAMSENLACDSTPSITREKSYSKIPPVRLFQKLLGLSSLGLDFAVVLPLAFIAAQLRHRVWILKGKPLLTTQEVKLPSRQLPYRVRVKNLSKAFYNPLAISIRHFPWHKKLLYHIQYTRPQWYRRYSSLAVARYFNFAILMVFCAMIGFGLYSTFFSSARKSPTLATGPVAPPRVLSFQGRLTDNNDNPITTANTHLRFAIYNSSSASGSALLWQEVDDVSPDTDGDFAAILGNNSTIPQSVFAQNNALWLGVTVENTAELTPRQQIATVAFATNAEVLQGMPPITQGATGAQANANTILALDSSGNLNLGQVTTTIQSTSGQFILSGKTLTLTTAPGSNTNIELAPDGSGLIDLQKPVQNSTLNNNIPSAAGAVEIDDLLAVLATSSGQSAFTINQNSTGPLISASTSGVAKFTVDSSGNVTAAGNVTGNTIFTGNGVSYYINNATSNLHSLTLSNDLTVSGTVNSDLIPSGVTGTWSLGDATHEWKNLYAQNLYINGQAFTQLFQRNAGVLSPLNIGDDIAVGGTSTASAKFQIFGLTGNATTTGTLTFAGGVNNVIAARNNQGITIGDAQTGNINFSSVNVGINATAPLAKLDARGSLSSIPVASISGNTSVPVLVVDNAGTGNLFSAQANGAQVFKIDTSGIVYASQLVDFNNNAFFLDPAATGTSLKVAGGIGVGGATPSTFTIQSAGHVGPDTTNLYDLGSDPNASGKQWRNIYGEHLFSNGVEVTQLWQENLGAVSPLNITDDLLLGATSTTSARFAVTNIAGGTPTASLSAGLNSGTYLTADGTLATRALQSLTIGSTSTGNINLGADATARAIALGNTTGATSLSLQAGTGNIIIGGATATTYTIGTSTGTGLITLGQSTAGENINIGNAINSSAQQIQIGNGASAANSEVDILSGAGTAGTSTLKLGNNSRVGTIDIGNIAPNVTRTITIAGGNSANDDTVNILTGNPSLGTQTVNILTGSATGGTQALNLGTGTSAKTITLGGSGNNTIAIGNTQNGGSISLGNAMTSGTLSIGGTGAQTGSITIGDGTGAQTIDLGNGSGNKTINIGGTGTANTINIGSNQTAGKVNIGVASTLTTIMGSNFTTGGVAYATGSAMFFTTAGSSGQCLLSNGASAPTWGLCTFGNGNYWDLQNGALFAKNPTTDLLIGGSATNSAKFAVLNVAGATPVASVSSGLNGNGMSLSADGFLQTTNKSTLTIGGTTTGNIVLSPQNGGGTGTITFNGYSTGILHSANGLITSSAVDLQNDVTSVLRVDHGGTGLNSLASGSLIYGSGSTTANALAIGNENDMLAVVNGTLAWSPYATHSALFVNNNAQLNTVSSATNQILPTTNGTLNLGDGSHYFGTIYANNVVVPVGNGTSGFWQLTSNVISPVNNFYDLAVGGSATGSATPFQVFGSANGSIPAGTASTSGNLSFRGSSSEIDLLGGTGLNIKSSPSGQGNDGLTSVLNITNIGNVTIAGTLAVNGNTLSTATTSTFSLLTSTINTLNFAAGTTSLNFGTGGTTTSSFNGNIVLGDNVSSRTLTLNARIGSEILSTGDNSHDIGATNNYWRNTFTNNLYVPPINTVAGLWQVSNNVIRPYYNWQDLAIGGTASFSAQFQVFASSYANDLGTVLAGTASTSGGLTFKGATASVTNFQANLLNNSTLAFYNSVGGDKGITLTNPQLFLNNNGRIGIGTTNPLGTLDIRGNSSAAPVATISGTTSTAALVISNTGTGNYLDINNGGLNIASFIQNGSLNHNTFVPGTTDSYDLGSNPTSGGREWDTLYVRQVITPSGSLGSNYWQLTSSVLAPANLFNDLAVGGASTASAAFQVYGTSYINDLGTVPAGTATTSGNITFRGTAGSQTAFKTNILNGASLGFYTSVGGDKGITAANPALFIAANASIGIGTNNPLLASGLDIEKNGLGNAVLDINQTGLGDIFTASVSGTTKLVVNNSGYLGLNTTTPQTIFESDSQGSLYPSDLLLAQATATNLVPNPSFENSSSQFTSWTRSATAQLGSLNATESALFGSKATRFYNVGPAATYTVTTSCIAVTAGTAYTASGYIYRVSGFGGNTGMDIQTFTNASCSTGQATAGRVNTTATDKWTRVTTTLTAAQMSGINGIEIRFITDGTNTNSRAYFDGAQLEQATAASPYLDGSFGPGYAWTGTPHNSASVRWSNSAFAYNTINSATGLGASSKDGFPTLQLDQNGSGDLIAASASGILQFKLDNGGIVTANSFVDLQNSAYMLDPANTGTSLTIAGTASSSGNLTFFGASTAHKVNILDNQSLGFYTSYSGDTGLASRPSLYIANSATGGNATGYVGIGTTSPYTGLEVASSSAFTEAVGSKNNPAINIKNTNQSSFNEKAELQFTVGNNNAPNAVITALYTDWTSPGASAGQTGADLAFSTKTSTTSLTEAMRIKNNGYIGIGTTNPDSLFVATPSAALGNGANVGKFLGDITGGNSFTNQLELGSTGVPNSPVRLAFVDISAAGYESAAIEGSRVSGGGGYLAFQTRPVNGGAMTEAMRINSSGNVGIGTTGPNASLEVVGPGATAIGGTPMSSIFRTSGGALATGLTANLNLASIGFKANTNSVALGIHAYRDTAGGSDWTTSNILLAMDVDGSASAGAFLALSHSNAVGINTANPKLDLHLMVNGATSGLNSLVGRGMAITANAAGRDRLYFENNSTGITSGQRVFQIDNGNTGGVLSFNSLNDAASAFNTNGQNILAIKYDGTVGIGTSNPTRNLDVTGDWGGKTVTDTQINPGTTVNGTPEQTAALGYYLSANKTSGNAQVITTFNITGIPDTEGTFAFIHVRADHIAGIGGSAQQCARVTINSNTVMTQMCDAVGNTTVEMNKSFIAMYLNSSWTEIAVNPTTSNSFPLTSSDLAEWIPFTGDRPVPGTILEPGSNPVSAQTSRGAYSQKALGIVTTNPNTVYGEQTPDSVAMALAGRVPAIVTSLNGPIQSGDSITTSPLSGIGMKPSQATQTVGKALEDYDPSMQGYTSVASLNDIVWPADDGTNSSHPSFRVPVSSLDTDTQALLAKEYNLHAGDYFYVGKVMVLVEKSYVDPQVYLTTTGDIHITEQSATPSADFTIPHYYTLSNALSQPITRMGAFAELAVGNLRAGSVNAQQVLTNSLAVATDNVSIAGQSLHDYIVNVVNQVLQTTSGNGTASPIAEVDQLHTNLISPLASDSAIMIDLQNSKVAVKNSTTGQTVASIDNTGNATFSGTLQSQNLAVNGDATVSGTLHAGKIVADDIEGLQATVGTLSAQNITNVTNIYMSSGSADTSRENSTTGSGTSSNNYNGLLTQNGNYADIASFSAYLSYVPNLKATTGMFTEGLISLGPTTLTDTSVAGTLTVGTQMSLADSSINVLGADLELQPLKQGGIAFVGGQVRIDTNGNLNVNGNAVVNGNLAVNTISPLAPGKDVSINLSNDSNANHNSQFVIRNASGSAALAINQLGDIVASGAANIAKLNFNFIQPAMAVSDTEVVATSSAGTAAIGAYQTQLTIDNTNVTANSLIYITPVGNTATTPYLMRQVPGTSFTVGISVPSSKEVNFNWLIVN